MARNMSTCIEYTIYVPALQSLCGQTCEQIDRGNYAVYDLAILRSEQKHAIVCIICMFRWMLSKQVTAQ
jgi:hypothetical protein